MVLMLFVLRKLMYSVSGDTFAVVNFSENSVFPYSQFIADETFQFTFKASQVTVCSVLITEVLGFFVSFSFSGFTGQQEKWEAISLTPLYHFHPFT